MLDELRSAGVRVLELDRGRQFDLAAWRPLVKLLREEGTHVLHSHKFGSNVWCSLIARLARVPIFVTHEHSWSFTGDRVRVALDRRVISSRADAMVAVSSVDARRMVEVEHIDERKIRVIPNGIPRPAPGDPGELRRELGVEAGVPIIGMIASLRPEKRVDLLLDAVVLLGRDRPAFHLAIVGDGPLAAELQAQAERAGIAGRVSFLGYRGDARELAAGFDIAALTSDREGMPLSLLEYMACGRAIVATAVGGIPTAVEHDREALLVAPGDAAELAQAFARLLDSPAERARLGDAAAVRQRAEFDLDGTVSKIEALYAELLGQRSSVE